MRTFQAKMTLLNVFASGLALVLLLASISSEAKVVAQNSQVAVSTQKKSLTQTKQSKKNSKKKTVAKKKPVAPVVAAPTKPTPAKNATSVATAAALTTAVTTEAPKKSWGIRANISRARSLYDRQDGNFQEGMDYSGSLSLKISEKWTTSLGVGYSQDLRYSEGSDWSDTSLRLGRKPWELSRVFGFAPSFSVIAPTSKESKQRQNMNGAVGTSGSFGFNDGILAEGWDVTAGLGVTRLSHQYDTAVNGRVNTQWSARQSLGVSYSFWKIGLSAEFVHKNAWTYQNNMKESFEHSEEISFEPANHFSVAVGHTLSGSALKANGVDSNMALMNENDSIVYGSISVSY